MKYGFAPPGWATLTQLLGMNWRARLFSHFNLSIDSNAGAELHLINLTADRASRSPEHDFL